VIAVEELGFFRPTLWREGLSLRIQFPGPNFESAFQFLGSTGPPVQGLDEKRGASYRVVRREERGESAAGENPGG
jgi:hypothetical protein